MKKYQRNRAILWVVLAMVGILTGIGFLSLSPIEYQSSEKLLQGDMAIAMTKPTFTFDKQKEEASGDIELKSYYIPQQEATELKQEILKLVSRLKYYRTPVTFLKNIRKDVTVHETEGSIFITLSGEENIRICGTYIIIQDTIYSLGKDGEEKAAKIYSEMDTLLHEKAGSYITNKNKQ